MLMVDIYGLILAFRHVDEGLELTDVDVGFNFAQKPLDIGSPLAMMVGDGGFKLAMVELPMIGDSGSELASTEGDVFNLERS